TPPVSVLKPVYGVDFGSLENFSSFCRQNYSDYEILFAVNDESDPAVPLIRSVMARFPHRRIRILTGAPRSGANQKVNNLALLTREAKHEILVLSDGDVRVGPNYLREVVAPLADSANAAVTCFYRAVAERNLLAEMKAFGLLSAPLLPLQKPGSPKLAALNPSPISSPTITSSVAACSGREAASSCLERSFRQCTPRRTGGVFGCIRCAGRAPFVSVVPFLISVCFLLKGCLGLSSLFSL